jgi:beta-galactosidase
MWAGGAGCDGLSNGGIAVISARAPGLGQAFTAAAIPISLTNLFGVELDSFQTYQPPSRTNNTLRFDDGGAPPVHVFAEVLRPTTARVIGRWERDYLKDSPAATEQQFGKGRAVYYGSLFNVDAARYLIKRYAAEIGLTPLLPDAPGQVEVTRRTKGGTDFYFLLNHGDSPATVNVGGGFTDVLTSGDATASLALPAFDYRVLKREQFAAGSSGQTVA